MKPVQARYCILAVFAFFLAVQVAALFLIRGTWPEDVQSLTLKLLSIYSVHLGLILGCLFAKPGGHSKKPSAGGLAWAAIVLSVFWNLLLALRTASFSFAAQDSVADLANYWDAVSSGGSFLVTGGLAFFFNKV
jgi:cytochrome bd-type quinol oxidase subunit 2